MKTVIGIPPDAQFVSAKYWPFPTEVIVILVNRRPPSQSLKSKPILDNNRLDALAFAIKTISKLQIGTMAKKNKKCRAAIGDVEAFRKDEKRRGRSRKTLWRNGIEEVLMDLSKVKNLLSLAQLEETWRGLGPSLRMPCARNVECLLQSLKVREQPERCDGIGYHDRCKRKAF